MSGAERLRGAFPKGRSALVPYLTGGFPTLDGAAEVGEAAAESGRLVFGDTAVRFPLSVAVVDCYADAK